MTTQRWMAVSLVSASVLALVANCSDNPNEVHVDTGPDTGVVVSQPVPQPNLANHSGRMAASTALSQIALTVSMTAGGIDPVPVPAIPGDTLELVATDSSGHSVRYVKVVKAPNAPVVIRTEPPKKKTDVPLNAAIVVVFSEP